MGSTTLTMTGIVTGLAQGQQDVNVIWPLPAAVGKWEYPTLAIGDNAISVPTGARTMLIIPPDNNAVVFFVKDTPGDAGSAADPTLPYFRSLGPSVSTVYLNVASLLSGPISIAFW